MLKYQPWLKFTDGFDIELTQAEDEGRIITDEIKSEYEEILKFIRENKDNPESQTKAKDFYMKVRQLPYKSDYKYDEPNDLEAIKKLRPENNKNPGLDKSILKDENKDKLYDRIFGAWLARCAGCLLGKPVEGWKKDNLHGLLKDTGNFPINYYISSDIDEEIIKKYNMNKYAAWINNVSFMPEDDDTNYTVIGLKILSSYGKDFTSDDVAECWLANLPILHVCTAERVAYRNLVNCFSPPESASFCNPYREWIGAQIRADFFGYITPANPELGAELAYRDASISHIKNGIYGEMWVAAMLSAAASFDCQTPDVIERIINAGLGEIPENCRLAEDIRKVINWKKENKTYDETIELIHAQYSEHFSHHWCHTNSNAMIVAAALIYGELDLEKTIGYAVMGAFDTDCNGATAGSVLGMLLGAEKLPPKWIDPLCDTIISGVDGFGKVKISYLAEETMKYIII